MKPILFVLLLAMGAFAAEAADGSNLQTDGSNLQQDSSVQQAADSFQQSVGSAQTSDTANNPDGNSNWPNSVHVICEMPDDDDDPETTVMENIGLVNDSLSPLGEYVEWADSSKVADSLTTVDSLDVEKPVVVEIQKNIPLPRQMAYTGKGLSIGIGAGVYNPTDDCDCVGNWQGQLEYFYTPTLSAGMDVRFLGGDLDSDVMIMYQRYRLNLRVHKVFERLDMYVEPVFGLENTSISEFREQVKSYRNGTQDENSAFIDSNGESTVADSVRGKCEKMFSLDGFSLGVGFGVGYNLNDFWGLTGSTLLEYNFSRAVQLTLTPGVALNLQRIWPWAQKNLRSTWLSLEVGTQRFFNRGVTEWATFAFLGFQIGV